MTTDEKVIPISESAVAETNIADSDSHGDASVSIVSVDEKFADVTLQLLEKYGDTVDPITPEKEKKLKRKLHLHVVFLVSIITLVLFVDKATLSYASILGLFEETGISTDQYNNLNSIFYAGYIIAQWPGSYMLQRVSFGKFVTSCIFLWSVVVFLHCVATNYGGLIAVRFLLGAVESLIIPAIEITLGMFFTKEEQAYLQPIFWTTSMGANIPAGFIAYGLLYSQSAVRPWKFFMIVTGSLTLLLAIYCFFFYPSNPAEARFLTLEEKIHTIKRVHESTQSSIEQKQFKKHQFIETLKDPVSWLFGLQAFTLMLANNLSYQQNLLYVSLGVSNLGSTLVSVAGSAFAVLVSIFTAIGIKRYPGHIAWWAALWCLPAIAGGIGMVALPWDHKLSLLACLVLAGNTFGISYIIALGWTTSSASGYTKKLTRNIFFMFGYGIANIISPQIWSDKDSPRYYPAWIVQIVIAWAGTPTILFIIRWILQRRNRERYIWIEEQRALGLNGEGYVNQPDGEKVKVDLFLLDLTDLENKWFIYPL